MPCDCIGKMNERLSKHNAELVTTIFGEPKAVISTMKLDPKKRGAPPHAIASFCPFCGVKHAFHHVSEVEA